MSKSQQIYIQQLVLYLTVQNIISVGNSFYGVAPEKYLALKNNRLLPLRKLADTTTNTDSSSTAVNSIPLPIETVKWGYEYPPSSFVPYSNCKSYNDLSQCQCAPMWEAFTVLSINPGEEKCSKQTTNPAFKNCVEVSSADQTKCGLCEENFKLSSSDSKCIIGKCDDGCKFCTNKVCQVCEQYFGKSKSGLTCAPTADPTQIDIKTAIENCKYLRINSDGSTSCYECDYGYVVNSAEKICIKIVPSLIENQSGCRVFKSNQNLEIQICQECKQTYKASLNNLTCTYNGETKQQYQSLECFNGGTKCDVDYCKCEYNLWLNFACFQQVNSDDIVYSCNNKIVTDYEYVTARTTFQDGLSTCESDWTICNKNLIEVIELSSTQSSVKYYYNYQYGNPYFWEYLLEPFYHRYTKDIPICFPSHAFSSITGTCSDETDMVKCQQFDQSGEKCTLCEKGVQLDSKTNKCNQTSGVSCDQKCYGCNDKKCLVQTKENAYPNKKNADYPNELTYCELLDLRYTLANGSNACYQCMEGYAVQEVWNVDMSTGVNTLTKSECVEPNYHWLNFSKSINTCRVFQDSNRSKCRECRDGYYQSSINNNTCSEIEKVPSLYEQYDKPEFTPPDYDDTATGLMALGTPLGTKISDQRRADHFDMSVAINDTVQRSTV